MKKYRFKIYKVGVILEGKLFESSECSITTSKLALTLSDTLSLKLDARSEVFVDSVYFDLDFIEPKSFKMFRNGFQSWSPSFEFNSQTKFEQCTIPVLRNHYLDPENYSEKESHFFTYLLSDGTYLLLAPENNSLKVSFELIAPLRVRVKFEIGRVLRGQFYTQALKIEESENLPFGKVRNKKIYGWTSWYYYYRKIQPDELKKNVDHIKKLPFKLAFFQIDDGWQEAIGDWYENDKFRNSLSEIASRINENGITPGIWLAPFVCERNSLLFKRQKSWLIFDRKGRPRPAGFNPLWSGYFYALDSLNDNFVEYLLERISNIRKAGFRMFKFDFLYALMVSNPKHFSRSRFDAFKQGMSLLREAIGDECELLGCGAPVLTEEWLYDYLRVGPDTKDGWEDALTKLMKFQGRVSAKNALRNTITRSFLNNRAFINDPDVVFFRPKRLTQIERDTVLITNFLLSDIIFFSDPIYLLEEKDFVLLYKLQEFESFLPNHVQELSSDVFFFSGYCCDNKINCVVNLSEHSFDLSKHMGNPVLGTTSSTIPSHGIGVFKE